MKDCYLTQIDDTHEMGIQTTITVGFAELGKLYLKLALCQSSHFYVFNFFLLWASR